VDVSKNFGTLTVSQTAMGKVLGISQPQISHLAKTGVLLRSDDSKILLIESMRNYYMRKVDAPTDRDISLDREKTLHEKAKREIAELKLGELKGQLHRTEDIDFMLGGLITVLRRNLLAMPAKMATSLVGKDTDEVNEIMTKYINSALSELATFKAADLERLEEDEEEN